MHAVKKREKRMDLAGVERRRAVAVGCSNSLFWVGVVERREVRNGVVVGCRLEPICFVLRKYR